MRGDAFTKALSDTDGGCSGAIVWRTICNGGQTRSVIHLRGTDIAAWCKIGMCMQMCGQAINFSFQKRASGNEGAGFGTIPMARDARESSGLSGSEESWSIGSLRAGHQPTTSAGAHVRRCGRGGLGIIGRICSVREGLHNVSALAVSGVCLSRSIGIERKVPVSRGRSRGLVRLAGVIQRTISLAKNRRRHFTSGGIGQRGGGRDRKSAVRRGFRRQGIGRQRACRAAIGGGRGGRNGRGRVGADGIKLCGGAARRGAAVAEERDVDSGGIIMVGAGGYGEGHCAGGVHRGGLVCGVVHERRRSRGVLGGRWGSGGRWRALGDGGFATEGSAEFLHEAERGLGGRRGGGRMGRGCGGRCRRWGKRFAIVAIGGGETDTAHERLRVVDKDYVESGVW